MLRKVASIATIALGTTAGCGGGDPTPNQPTSTPTLSNSASSSGGTTPSGSSSSSSSGGSSSSSSSSGGSQTVDACISACEAEHPNAAAKSRAIDQCWSQNCPTACNGIGTGMDVGPTKGSCQTDVKTPSAECSTCTVQFCCGVWDACFGDADCIALNQCSVACYGK